MKGGLQEVTKILYIYYMVRLGSTNRSNALQHYSAHKYCFAFRSTKAAIFLVCERCLSNVTADKGFP